jgi:integrase
MSNKARGNKMSVKLRKRKLANGNLSLYLDIYHGGKRQYEFLRLYLTKDKTTSKETFQLAESIRAKRQLEIQHSEHGFIPHFKKKANFVDYFERIAVNKPSDHRAWNNTLKHLKEFTDGGRIQFSAVTEDWLETFKTYLLSRVSNNTAHLYFSNIKAVLKQAVKDKIIAINPGDHVSQIKKQNSAVTFLTLEEIQKLAHTHCRDHEVKRAFLFSSFTGLRLSDVRGLQWENINGDSIEFRQKKTGGFEYLHLSPMAKQILAERPDVRILNMRNSEVFRLPSQTRLHIVLKQWSNQAGLDKRVTFHTARHTFATLALTEGVDLYTVSKLLGHKTIQATQIYAKVIDEKKRAAMELLPIIKVSG